MATRIRLKRMGAKKQAFYRIVVSDSRSPRDGRFIETLGYYNPLTRPAEVKVDEERLAYWMGVGALPSDAVVDVLRQRSQQAAAPAPKAKTAEPKPEAVVEPPVEVEETSEVEAAAEAEPVAEAEPEAEEQPEQPEEPEAVTETEASEAESETTAEES